MLRKEVDVAVVSRLLGDKSLADPDSLARIVGQSRYYQDNFLQKYNPDIERTDVFPRMTYFSKRLPGFQDKEGAELHIIIDDRDQNRFEAMGLRTTLLLSGPYKVRPVVLGDGTTLRRLEAAGVRIGMIKFAGEEDASDPKNKVFRKRLVFEISYAVL